MSSHSDQLIRVSEFMLPKWTKKQEWFENSVVFGKIQIADVKETKGKITEVTLTMESLGEVFEFAQFPTESFAVIYKDKHWHVRKKIR